MPLSSLPPDIQQRYALLKRSRPDLVLYALVDGLQYEQCHAAPLAGDAGKIALFEGTDDAPLANAGPWLVEVEQSSQTAITALNELEQASPGVSWLISPQPLQALAQHLRERIDIRMPDGRIALFRYWDPRVMVGLASLMSPLQRQDFFMDIEEWHLLDHGHRRYIGRHHAYA